MRFLVDNQLPFQLARYLEARGHDAVHVVSVGLDEATDDAVWAWAERERRTVISKDEDLLFLAKRTSDAFASGQRIVELG